MPHHYDIIGPGHNGLTSACPIPELGQDKTPVPNVYLCSSGSHPDPGVPMAPGRNAAQVIFGDLKLDFTRAISGF
jgi:hypothetical protein